MRRALLVVIVAAVGCDWSLQRMQAPQKCTVDGTTALLPHGSCNLEPPAGIVAMDGVAPAPPITRALVERGRDRFQRICAPCHGVAADGNSQIARAMLLRRPPSLVSPAVITFSDQRILTVISAGYGLMPEYGSLLASVDRFAVLQYVRVLQQRDIALDELAPAQQAEALRWLP